MGFQEFRTQFDKLSRPVPRCLSLFENVLSYTSPHPSVQFLPAGFGKTNGELSEPTAYIGLQLVQYRYETPIAVAFGLFSDRLSE